MNQTFQIKQIDDRTWHIDVLRASIYLLVGSKSALLIDTAYGIGDLQKCVSQITKLSVKVVLTHGHPDHIGGIGAFGDVYLGTADIAPAALLTEERIGTMVKMLLPEKTDPTFSLMPSPRFHAIKEGDVFDLGDRKLTVIEVPGHTLGSIALLDEENGMLFGGDACNPNELLSLNRELRCVLAPGTCFSSVEVMRNSLQKILDLPAERIFTGHLNELGFEPATKQLAKDLIACCDKILDGTVQTSDLLIAASDSDPEFQAIRTGEAVLSYNPLHIHDEWQASV